MSGRRRVVVVTGSRADYGLLRPVMRAVTCRPELELITIVAGAHLLGASPTAEEVAREFPIAARVRMQRCESPTRCQEADALGRGIRGMAKWFGRLDPDWVVVLGDRIEALAAAAAGSVGGWAVAHLHGGDRAEGIADEAIRHAVTRLAHLHLAATEASGRRLVAMGEVGEFVRVVGSPAIDDLGAMEPMEASEYDALGRPEVVVVMHPIGRDAADEARAMHAVLDALDGERVVALYPNNDPGRAGIVTALCERARNGMGSSGGGLLQVVGHLPRARFVGLLKRLAAQEGSRGGVMVGNSSGGLIEAAALRLPVVDIGPRQAGRERPGNVVHVEHEQADAIRAALEAARRLERGGLGHPYGDGRAGERVAAALVEVDPHSPRLRRKRCTY